jgi:hypothetical protein
MKTDSAEDSASMARTYHPSELPRPHEEPRLGPSGIAA